MMESEVKNWLERRWRQDNHPKYHQYFNAWYSNITQEQLDGFTHQMQNLMNGVLYLI